MTYTIICKKCKGKSVVMITDMKSNKYITWKKVGTIISGRMRMDGNWGWQCMCGNNDIMTAQEKRVIKNPANPEPQEIKNIIENLKPDTPKFKMEKM